VEKFIIFVKEWYLAPWLTRWISPDAAGAVEGVGL
jgi:hypothetical protein